MVDVSYPFACYLKFGVGCMINTGLIHRALAVLPDEAVRTIFDREFHSYPNTVATFAYRLEDPALWERLLTALEKSSQGAYPQFSWEFGGNLGLAAVPLLQGAFSRTKSREFKTHWWESMIVAIGQAAARGEEIPRAYDKLLDFGRLQSSKNDYMLFPFFSRTIYTLDPKRGEAILLKGLQSKGFPHAFRMIGLLPTENIVKTGFERFLALEPTLPERDQLSVVEALRGLVDPTTWTKWLVDNGISAETQRLFAEFNRS